MKYTKITMIINQEKYDKVAKSKAVSKYDGLAIVKSLKKKDVERCTVNSNLVGLVKTNADLHV